MSWPCRISPPGEFCTSSFSESPEWHEFPVCCLLKSVAVKISLAAVSRRPSVPKVICSHPQHCRTAEHNSQHRDTAKRDQQQQQCCATEFNNRLSTLCKHAATSCRDGALEDATAHTQRSQLCSIQTSTPQPSSGAIPKVCHLTPTFKEHAEEAREKCALWDPAHRKVLYTKNAEGLQAYYPKDKSRTASPDIDYLVNKTLGGSTELEPLSPMDMQLYLLSLAVPGHDRADMRHDENAIQWPVGKQPPARTNLLRAFTDSVDKHPLHLQKLPPPKCLSSTLVQQLPKLQQQQQQKLWQQPNQQRELQKCQQQQRVQPNDSAERQNFVSMNCCDALTLHKEKTDTVPKGDMQVCLKDNAQVCHGNDVQICHKVDTNVFDDGELSTRNKNEMTSDDGKEQPSGTTDGVTFSLGDGEPAAVMNGAVRNALRQCDVSPSPTIGHDSDNTLSRRPCSTSSRRPFHKSISIPTYNAAKFPGFSKVSCLLRSVIRKELMSDTSQVKPSDHGVVNGQAKTGAMPVSSGKPVPSQQDRNHFQKVVSLSSKLMFRCGASTPLQSSPAPIKKKTSGCFDFDSSLTTTRAIKNSISCVNLDKHGVHAQDDCDDDSSEHFYSASAPASTNRLLGNFEESLLNGRIEPTGVVEGFTADIGASGDFCPKHVQADVTAFFFSLSDDNAPSPYLGHISLDCAGRRGYHVPRHGTVQVTLFNPNKTVVKMFVVMYNLSDMPTSSQTFLRQRTLYTPVKGSPSDLPDAPSYLRYLIHLRFMSSRTGKIYLHTDIRLIFARDKFEYDARVANYELRSFTEGPKNPEFSPKS